MYLCIDKNIPSLRLENVSGMLLFFFLIVNIQNVLLYIDDFYLKLEAIFEIILKLYAYHNTLSNGNTVRKKRMDNFSHNAENETLCKTG